MKKIRAPEPRLSRLRGKRDESVRTIVIVSLIAVRTCSAAERSSGKCVEIRYLILFSDLYPPALSPKEKGSCSQLVSLSSGEGLRERSGVVIFLKTKTLPFILKERFFRPGGRSEGSLHSTEPWHFCAASIGGSALRQDSAKMTKW